MWFKKCMFHNIIMVIIFVISYNIPADCNVATKSDFNASVRDYSVQDENTTAIAKTLQQEEPRRYANFAPIHNPIRFKVIPDNALSSSSYKGLFHHEHSAYGLHDYEDPHYAYGYYYKDHHDHDHHGYDYDHHHDSDHHYGHHKDHHDDHHHLSHGHHSKHYSHALAAKAILWPIAGLAFLGAAAALVSNPVLLQLGVVSGRKKRDTRHITRSKIGLSTAELLSKDVYKNNGETTEKNNMEKRTIIIKNNYGKKRIYSDKNVPYTKDDTFITDGYISNEDNRYIPIPLKFKNNY